MTRLEDSIAELEKTLRRIEGHFLYGSEVSRAVLQALNHDALSHSDRMEVDTSSSETLERLKAAWDRATKTFEGQITLPFIASVAAIVDPEKGKLRAEAAAVRGRNTMYLMTNHAKVEREVAKLAQGINGTTKHPAIAAAELHLYFAIIHPLGDGNGRVSRLLQNVLLYHSQIPPITIPHTERLTYLNHIEDALLGFRERSGQDAMFDHQSYGELRFIEYVVDKCKGNAERMVDKMERMRRYSVKIGKRRKPDTAILRSARNTLRSTLASQSTIPPVISLDTREGIMEVVTCAPEVTIVGVLERFMEKRGISTGYTVIDTSSTGNERRQRRTPHPQTGWTGQTPYSHKTYR